MVNGPTKKNKNACIFRIYKKTLTTINRNKMQEVDTATNAELAEFLRKSKARLKAILERLQWTEADVLRQFNTNSAAVQQQQQDNDEAAEETAAVKDEEPPLPESYDSKNSIVIAPEELRELVGDATAQIPVKFSDSLVQFTREQRLRLYEYVVERTGKCTEPEQQVPTLDDGQTTFAEIVAQKRREKKNKRRHRTSKPTHVEEVRSLVELQMQALQQYEETRQREAHEKDRRREQPMKTTTRRHRSRSRESRKSTHLKHTKRSQSRQDEKRRKRSRSRSYQREKHRKYAHKSRSRSRSTDRTKRERSREAYSKRKHRSRERSRSTRENSRKRLEKSPHRKEHKSKSSRRHRRSRSRSGSYAERHGRKRSRN